jgi:3'-phosphoadenosine 5'-phosphosulfate sulfotransferase (PAPS reductase)/FAD synthetase
MTRHVIQMSGGIGSWAAAQRVAAEHGTGDLVLLFADTLVEDPDLYRFLDDAAAQLGVPITRVADGRTPFEVFRDQRFLGNNRIAPCTVHLKQQPCRAWLAAHADLADTILYIGVDHSEERRRPAIERGWAPWMTAFPLCEPPLLSKAEMLAWARSLGLRTPAMYDRGFAHNNCQGACVRAGQRQWLHLLATDPDLYARKEREEQQLREQLGDVAILRDRRGGGSRPLTLAELRRRQSTTSQPVQETLPTL